MALQQEYLFCSTNLQSCGYHSHATDSKGLAEQKAHSGRPASAGVSRPPRPTHFEVPARGHERPHHSPGPGPGNGPFPSHRPPHRLYPGSDRGGSFRPPSQHPHARAHIQQEDLEPWEDRRHRSNGGRQQPNWNPASAASFPAAQKAEQSGVREPRISASRTPAFGGRSDDHARPGTHESRERLPNDTAAQVAHDADRGRARWTTSEVPTQHSSTRKLHEHAGRLLGCA